MNKKIRIIKSEPLLILAFPFAFLSLVILILLRPVIKIRIGFLHSDRIGHFAGNTELYLCEKDLNLERGIRTLDLFYFARKPCNEQLALMWSRELIILPWFFMRPLDLLIRSFSQLSFLHAKEAKGGDLDVDNLLDRFPIHLRFTEEEEKRGQDELFKMGVAEKNTRFICLFVRDSSYLAAIYPGADTSYHNFRDAKIENFVLAAEEMAKKGYYVIRMGAKVQSRLNSLNPRVIDYASDGFRNDFMDIYLGAKCFFCLTTGSGWDAVPEIFRRPIAYVNYVSLFELHTFRKDFLAITKKHVLSSTKKMLSLSDIFSMDVGYCERSEDYYQKGVHLEENTQEEIRDLALEMEGRLNNTFIEQQGDEDLQKKFWDLFPHSMIPKSKKLHHGEIRSRYGINFLRNNPDWLSG